MFVSRHEGFAVLAVVISGRYLFSLFSFVKLNPNPMTGLPGAAGSIFVSRLSTSLHAAAFALSHLSASATVRKDHEPSPGLVMLTLLLITLPVEVIFLGIVDSLQWLNLPILFAAFAIVFFCCAVRFFFFFFPPLVQNEILKQVLISLIVARFLIDFLWSKNRDGIYTRSLSIRRSWILWDSCFLCRVLRFCLVLGRRSVLDRDSLEAKVICRRFLKEFVLYSILLDIVNLMFTNQA